jgi:acyl carrier protein phosphodiesterase
MNFLGHAVFSPPQSPAIRAGNLCADYVKGSTALASLPAGIQTGIRLHRAIDAFSDAHPAAKRAAVVFREAYGRYSPAIVDTLFDHFLANDPYYFPSEGALKDFAAGVYIDLVELEMALPVSFVPVAKAMAAQDWLTHYRTLGGIRRSLDGLARRANYLPPVEAAYETFIGHYHILAQCWQEMAGGLEAFVKSWREES